MFKRNPIIAAVMLVLVISGIVWAITVTGRIILYNPVDRMRMSDLPPEATDIESFDFSSIGTPDEFDVVKIETTPVIADLAGTVSAVRMTGIPFKTEEEYRLEAETRFAFDPLKDDVLRRQLLELADLKQDFSSARANKVRSLHDMFCEDAHSYLFIYKLFADLSNETITSSKENPNIYPLRQAEAKSKFYESRKLDAETYLKNLDQAFDRSVEDDLQVLQSEHDEIFNEKVIEIRDYLLEKTAAIEMEVLNENSKEAD